MIICAENTKILIELTPLEALDLIENLCRVVKNHNDSQFSSPCIREDNKRNHSPSSVVFMVLKPENYKM